MSCNVATHRLNAALEIGNVDTALRAASNALDMGEWDDATQLLFDVALKAVATIKELQAARNAELNATSHLRRSFGATHDVQVEASL